MATGVATWSSSAGLTTLLDPCACVLHPPGAFKSELCAWRVCLGRSRVVDSLRSVLLCMQLVATRDASQAPLCVQQRGDPCSVLLCLSYIYCAKCCWVPSCHSRVRCKGAATAPLGGSLWCSSLQHKVAWRVAHWANSGLDPTQCGCSGSTDARVLCRCLWFQHFVNNMPDQ